MNNLTNNDNEVLLKRYIKKTGVNSIQGNTLHRRHQDKQVDSTVWSILFKLIYVV